MIRFLVKKARFYKHAKAVEKERFEQEKQSDKIRRKDISTNLQDNLDNLKELFGQSHDFKTHAIKFGANNMYSAAVVYIDGLVDLKVISNSIIKPLIENQEISANNIQNSKQDNENQDQNTGQSHEQSRQQNTTQQQSTQPANNEILKHLKEEVLFHSDLRDITSYKEVSKACLNGNTVLFVEGCEAAIVINSAGWDKRAVTEPQSETVVRGPREGFTENIKTNSTLIRRKIKSDKLRVDQMAIGDKTQTEVYIMYLEGVAKDDVVKEVKRRLKKIDVDSILESGYIEQYIEDCPFSPFSTIGYTEKPDVAAGKILEGRVAIVVDGTPFVLTVPMLFIESIQTSEDYYSRPFQVSLNRLLRLTAYFISIFMPALFIALTSFHQELIPTTLLITIANAREGTPFPVILEALIMIVAFEVLREAGIRLPRPVGQAISIVGALIMGEAAVSAGLVGAPMVITIAFTAVASFLVPNHNDASSFLRIVMIFLGAMLGFFGILMGAMFLLVHLCSITSFGVPYFDSFQPTVNLQDTFVRMPLWFMKSRPEGLVDFDKTRRSHISSFSEEEAYNDRIKQGKNNNSKEKKQKEDESHNENAEEQLLQTIKVNNRQEKGGGLNEED